MLTPEFSLQNPKISLILASGMLVGGAAAQTSVSTAPKPSNAPISKLFGAGQLLRDLQTLSADQMEGRATGSRGANLARNYIVKRFSTLKLKPFGTSYLQPFNISLPRSPALKEGVNIVGRIAGKTRPDRVIIITAHYDHLGMRGQEPFNGADDNASGTAALFAIASYFSTHKPSHSLIFVAFDGEELGLLGSKHFVSHLPIAKSGVVMNINMDMMAHNEKSELYATGTYQNPFLKPYLQRLQKQVPIKLLLGHDDPKTGHDDWTSQSDQGSFYDAKIPFIYFGVEDHKDYHKVSDDYATIHPKFYIGAVETVVKAVEMLDKALK